MPRKITPSASPGNKWCHGHRRELPVEAFIVDRSKADGRAHGCRECDTRKRKGRREVVHAMADTYARLSALGFTRQCIAIG